MQIAELKFGDVGRGISRYRPVALAVAAIAVMGLTLPGPDRVAGGNLFGTSSFGSSAPSVAPSGDIPEAASSGEVAAAVSAIESQPDSFSSTFSSGSSSSFSSISPSSSRSSFESDATVTRSDAARDDDSATFDSSTPATSETQPVAAPQPLKVTTAAWASAQAGTPLAAQGVPAGSLPVGRRPGFELDKVAFVRLSGSATTLKLSPHEDASGKRSTDAAKVQVCQISTPSWQKAEGQAMADAPKWDCAVSVLGKPAADGSWTFDLSVFQTRTDPRGFALIPAGDALDFQVAFKVA